jgi:hypothetical protein
LGRRGSKGAIFFHCTSVSNGPDRAIRPPTALLTLLISHFRQFNHSHLNGLSTVVQQLLELCNEHGVLGTRLEFSGWAFFCAFHLQL